MPERMLPTSIWTIWGTFNRQARRFGLEIGVQSLSVIQPMVSTLRNREPNSLGAMSFLSQEVLLFSQHLRGSHGPLERELGDPLLLAPRQCGPSTVGADIIRSNDDVRFRTASAGRSIGH